MKPIATYFVGTIAFLCAVLWMAVAVKADETAEPDHLEMDLEECTTDPCPEPEPVTLEDIERHLEPEPEPVPTITFRQHSEATIPVPSAIEVDGSVACQLDEMVLKCTARGIQ